MKLYTYPTAPNPRRVHLYLAEKGIELPCETVDIMTRANRQPEFLEKVNKLGGLPVLELDDGTHIAESVAICRYLEVLHPEPPLFGTTAEEQGRIEMWSRRIELNLMRPVGMVWVHGSPFTRGVVKRQIPEVAEQNRSLVRDFHSFLDRELASRAFVAGPEFTIADILALTTIDFAAKLVELPVDPALAYIAAWHANLAARPSVAANP
ncbi:MAG: glutathione S-transferase [Myxococcales bacterium]|nr:glutathione S-transferase [Myxococcales bacterium]